MSFHTHMKMILCLTMILIAGCETLTEYEREDRRLRRHDSLVAYLNACQNTSGLVVMERKHIRSNILKSKKQGHPYTIDNVRFGASRADFGCVDISALFRRNGW